MKLVSPKTPVGIQPDPQQEGGVKCFRISQLFHESSLGQRQEWRKHLGTASMEGKQLKMEVKIEDLSGPAAFQRFPLGRACLLTRRTLPTMPTGVECPGVLHRSPRSSCPLCVSSLDCGDIVDATSCQYISHGLIGGSCCANKFQSRAVGLPDLL